MIRGRVFSALTLYFALSFTISWNALGAGGKDADTIFPHPILHVPMIKTAPKIDGVIDEKEWASAARITGFMTLKEKVLLPKELQPVWYVAWDEENLYLAQRYQIYPKGTILATERRGDQGGSNPDAGNNILREDHVEIQFGTIKDREKIFDEFFYKLIVNAYGAVEDARPRMTEGWPGLEWDSGALVGSKVSETEWSLELAIPLRSLGYSMPVPENTRIYTQLVSSSDPEQFWAAWVPHSWKNWRLFPELVLDRKTPAIRVESLGPLDEGKLNVRVSSAGGNEEAVDVTAELVDSNGKKVYGKTEKLKAVAEARFSDENVSLPKPLDLTWTQAYLVSHQMNHLKLEAKSSSGEILFRNEYRFTYRPADLEANWLKPYAARRKTAKTPDLHTAYLPYYDKLEVFADTDMLGIDPAFKEGKKVRVKLETALLAQHQAKAATAGLQFLDKTLEMPEKGPLTATLDVPKLKAGQYLVTLQLLDMKGKAVHTATETFTRRDFEWEHNSIGKELNPIPPFDPITRKTNSLKLWNREYSFSESGLPRSMISGGVEFLASPLTVTAKINGSECKLSDDGKLVWTFDNPGRMTAEGNGKIGQISAKTKTVTEYDGLCMVSITLDTEKSVEIEQMALAINMPAKVLNCFMIQDLSCQVGAHGELPTKDGEFWNSNMSNGAGNIKGKFLPVLYIGDGERGLYYVSESDEGWILDPAKPANTLSRKGDVFTLTLHLVNKKAKIEKPRTLTFGLQAVPVKPMPYDYRKWEGIEKSKPSNAYLAGFGGASNTCSGTGPGMDSLTMRDDLDYEIMRNQILAYKRSEYPDYNYITHRYATNNTMGQGMKEFDTYAGEWSYRTNLEPHPMPGYQTLQTPFGRFDARQGTRQWADMTESNVDMRVWAFDQHQRKCGINGYHWDHQQYWSSGSPIRDTAYVADDGTTQGKLNILKFRELFKRMAVVSHQNAMRPWQGRYPPGIMPMESFCTQMSCYESKWYCKGYDQLTRFGTLARYRAYCGRYNGLPVYHFPSVADPAEAYPIQTRSVIGLALLHDIGFGRTGGFRKDVLEAAVNAVESVDYFNASTEWTPYWRSGELVKIDGKGLEVVATVYVNRKPLDGPKALLVVFNAGDKDVDAAVSPLAKAILGKDSFEKILDGETGKALEMNKGAVTIPVKSHDFKLVYVR